MMILCQNFNLLQTIQIASIYKLYTVAHQMDTWNIFLEEQQMKFFKLISQLNLNLCINKGKTSITKK